MGTDKIMRIRAHSPENGMKNSNLGMTVYGNLGQNKENHSNLGMTVQLKLLLESLTELSES